jgi:L-threonylcarbamoyladenylate synthase
MPHPDASRSCVTERLCDDAAGIAAAAEKLRRGQRVAFPTETVYGLGADARNASAIAGIFEAKGRPHFNPLIIHVGTLDEALALGEFSRAARLLADRFWPGPLTLVVPMRSDAPIAELARAGLSSLALRIPSHRTARALLASVGMPVAAPSANRSGHVSPTRAAHVLADLDQRIEAIIEGGPAPIGIESTIIACLAEGVVLLRSGAISQAMLEAELGQPILPEAPEEGSARLAPGRLRSHYAPFAPLRLDATLILPGEACLAFGPDLPEGAKPELTENLSARGDLVEAAANLYQALRALDSRAPFAIAAMPIPARDLGIAIRDRLARASIRASITE